MFFGSVEKPPRLSAFDLEVPDNLIADKPTKARENSKLMVLNRKDMSIEHKKFKDVVSYFKKGEVLVLNNTKVYPARLYAKKDKSDAQVEVFLLRELANNLWEAMVKPARKVRIGNKLILSDEITCDVIDNTVSGGRVLRFDHDEQSLYKFIDTHGLCPLPPYIKRPDEGIDKDRYATVYEDKKLQESVAAPTAGLHFDNELLSAIKKIGVNIATINLSVGAGTFQPVKVDNIEEHDIHSEYLEVSPMVVDMVKNTKALGKKVFAVGTTATRALETAFIDQDNKGFSGYTKLFIYPGYKFKVVDRLITNFHLPKSSLLMLVSAFIGYDNMKHIYKTAVDKKYRFLSYGDAMLLKKHEI